MREIRGRRGTLHKFLEDEKVKTAFAQNIKDEKHSSKSAYNDGKSDKIGSIKWTLEEIYYGKCAFCEELLSIGEIEHFRPKNRNKNQSKKCDKSYSYYWLAFSWDNLLPSCKKCNIRKSNCFDIDGVRICYNNEPLADLHYKMEEYREKEQPKLLHPEYDRFENEIEFRKQGRIYSKDKRVQYTVRVCNLNRKKLRDSRFSIITDFEEALHEHFISFDNHLNNDNLDECLEYFKVTIKKFCKKSNVKYEYSLVRKSIQDNFEQFLESMDINFDDEDYAKEIILTAFLKFRND